MDQRYTYIGPQGMWNVFINPGVKQYTRIEKLAK